MDTLRRVLAEIVCLRLDSEFLPMDKFLIKAKEGCMIDFVFKQLDGVSGVCKNEVVQTYNTGNHVAFKPFWLNRVV